LINLVAFTLHNPLPTGSVPGGLATLSLAIALGIGLGNICIKGVRLGVAAVLFSALLFGQLGLTIEPHVLEFFRDFALVLFVYTIGMQLGPGFLSSLREEGLKLNVLAVATLVLGAILSGVICLVFHLPHDIASGIFTGGFATTPALAAAQEAIRQVGPAHGYDPHRATALVNLAYSVAYPFGLTGPILLVIALRFAFRINVDEELRQLAVCEEVRRPPLAITDIEVTHPSLNGVALRDQRFLQNRGVIFTRVLKGSTITVPTGATELQVGDIVRAFGPQPALDELISMVGQPSKINLAEVGGSNIERAHVRVTHRHVLGKTLRELDLINQHGVTLSRVNRAGVDLPARAALKLQFGDAVTAVGPAAGLRAVEKLLGNSIDALNYTQLIPIFVGMWLGVIAGSIPLPVPGLSTTLRIGLAGGPMLVAIILSRIGNIGPLVWYMPGAANQVLRDFGMSIFLACVGFQSGDGFVQKLIYGGGLPLVLWGACVTIIPMTIVALYARLVMKMNFVTLAGLISGAMTSSPTLLFSNETTKSNQPAVAYAAVYPLSMLVPVFAAQLLVTLLMR
jgi:putative transport protein